MTLAPIALFAYNRPDHLRQTIEALQKNELSDASELYVFSDGPKDEMDIKKVESVRDYLKTASGFKKITIIARDRNLGLAQSIISGVTEIVSKFGRIIVIEDDMVTSPYFLSYMNEALDKFADDNRVASIHGWCFPTERRLPEALFMPGADCWGWATWRRGWELFKPDGNYLLKELKRRKMTQAFDLNGAYLYTRMLEDQTRGKNDSWAVRWHASVFLEDRLCLYPGRTLVYNIGNDGSGAHCGTTTEFDSLLSSTPIVLNNIKVESSEIGIKACEEFYRKLSPVKQPIKIRIHSILQLQNIKVFIKDLIPPVVLRLARRALQRSDPEIFFDGEYATWGEAAAKCTGYDAPHILSKVLDAALKVRNGETAYERDSVLFDKIEYAWPLLSGLMLAAARNSGRLNVLDFGGALGSSYFQNRKFLQKLPEVRWNVIEQAHYADAGRINIQNEQLRFYSTIEECLKETKPNVILLSSVLQYLKEPEKLLDELTQLDIDTIIIDRTSFTADGGKKHLFVQHVPESIYKASYPIWLFNENEIIGLIASKGYKLIESFDSLDNLDNRGIWKGFIFQSTKDHANYTGGESR